MTATTFTPKQIARALGVSESSVKRWVDNGRLPATKTAGGHRKVPHSSLVSFIRETGHELADPALIGMVTTAPRVALEDSCDRLYDELIAGRETSCRDILLAFYQRGESLPDLGDRLIGPVFQRIGQDWAEGLVQIHQERRACEIVMATLHEIRRWLPPSPADAPLAMVATPLRDFAELPARLIELTLAAAGWRVDVAGSGLPLEEIREAVTQHGPELVCLSATHLDDAADFASQCNSLLIRPLRSALLPITPQFIVGGSALDSSAISELECDLFATTLSDLDAYQAGLRQSA